MLDRINDIGWNLLNEKDKEEILKAILEGVYIRGPFHIEIHPTDRCTTRCFFCSTRWRREKNELDISTISSIAKQMKELDVKTILLSGGGEPLAHREKEKMLEILGETGIQLFNVTTNGVGLSKIVRNILINLNCQQVIVSLNCGTEGTYKKMMQVGSKTFYHILENIKALVEERGKKGFPKLIIQFLVYKKNYNTIINMFNLAKDLKADAIIFNGLSFLDDKLKMKKEETEEMLRQFKEILKVDEYRRILGIYSFEQDICEGILKIEREIGDERSSKSYAKKFWTFYLKIWNFH